MNPAFRPILLETAETLAIALAGGVTFLFLGLPAGLVSGAVVAVAAAALLGRPMRVPLTLARICYVVVGTLLGTVVTPETLRGVITWPASVALLMLASLGMIAATMTYLRVVHCWDPLSALMGASPGSMAQVFALSSELGGDCARSRSSRPCGCSFLSLDSPMGSPCSAWSCRRCPCRGARRDFRCSAKCCFCSGSLLCLHLFSSACDFPADYCSARLPVQPFCTAPGSFMPRCPGGSAAPL